VPAPHAIGHAPARGACQEPIGAAIVSYAMHRSLCALVLVACGGSSATPVDSGSTIDGPCGADLFFTGEYLDWDASNTRFCGIFQATFQDHDDATRKFVTNPNGRFELCVPAGARIDITPPAAASQCNGAMYATKGIAIADPTSIGHNAIFSARSFGGARRDAFFAAAGLTYSAAKAHVFVHLAAAAKVTTPATHDAAQAYDGTSWTTSDTGVNVFLPNVDLAAGTVSISVAGGRTVSVPVAADTISYASP
jgi:hypothetical protein